MDKELLVLYGALHCVRRVMDTGSSIYARKDINNEWERIRYNEIRDALKDMIDEYRKEITV